MYTYSQVDSIWGKREGEGRGGGGEEGGKKERRGEEGRRRRKARGGDKEREVVNWAKKQQSLVQGLCACVSAYFRLGDHESFGLQNSLNRHYLVHEQFTGVGLYVYVYVWVCVSVCVCVYLPLFEARTGSAERNLFSSSAMAFLLTWRREQHTC